MRAEAADPLTLSQAVGIALEKNPRMALSRAGEEVARARRSQARAAWLPQISLSESFTRGDNPVFVFGTLLEQGKFGAQHFDPGFLNDPDPLSNWRLAATVRYPLFDQLRRVSAVEQTAIGVKQAVGATDAAAQAMRLEVIERYAGLLVTRARRNAAGSAVEASDSGLKHLEDRFEAGLAAEADLLAAKTQAAEFRQQAIEAEGAERIARSALASTLGMRAEELPPLNETLGDPHPELPAIDDAIRDARSTRRELESSRLAEHQAGLGVRTATGQFLPRVDGFYSYGASGRSFDEHDDDATYGAVLSWTVLDPGRLGRLAEARANQHAARAATELLEQAVDLETVTAYERLRAAIERREVAARAVDQARESARMVRDRYNEGLTTITEELRAQAALLRAEFSHAGARSDVYVDHANLLRSTGRLNDVDAFE
jgi:outer membrane protein TolC